MQVLCRGMNLEEYKYILCAVDDIGLDIYFGRRKNMDLRSQPSGCQASSVIARTLSEVEGAVAIRILCCRLPRKSHRTI